MKERLLEALENLKTNMLETLPMGAKMMLTSAWPMGVQFIKEMPDAEIAAALVNLIDTLSGIVGDYYGEDT